MSIKINRALKLASIGANPDSAAAMLEVIPAEAIKAVTAHQLAAMLDAVWRACQASKAIATREALDEGAIWDAGRGRLREIAA